MIELSAEYIMRLSAESRRHLKRGSPYFCILALLCYSNNLSGVILSAGRLSEFYKISRDDIFQLESGFESYEGKSGYWTVDTNNEFYKMGAQVAQLAGLT